MAGEQARSPGSAAPRSAVLGSAGGFLPVLPPVFALVELALFAAVIAAEWLWDPFPDLTKLNPHPYWLLILLISLQYGTVSGFLAAALAIGGTVLIGLPEQDIGEAYFGYLVRAWAQPVLWLIVALLLGGFRMRQIELRDDLLHNVDELESQSRLIDVHAQALQTRCDRLEREFVARAKPETDRLLDALARLASGGDPADVDAALEAAFPAAQASVFTRSGDRLHLVHAHRWPANARASTVFNGTDPLTQAVLGDGRSLSLLMAADEKLLAGEGVLAVPILDQQKQPIGMLKIETLPPAAIGPTSVQRLNLLAHHLARTLPALGGIDRAAGATTLLRPTGIAVPRLIRRSTTLLPARAIARRDVAS